MLRVDIIKKLPEYELDISFSAEREVTAILGPSGAGKTVTLQCIAGLMTPDDGSIIVDERPLFDQARNINLKPQRRKVGMVFQNYALFPHLTCYDNIAFGIQDRPRPEIRALIDEYAKKLRIQQLLNRFPSQISAGQQQRVALARALITDPEILLLDEPFSALDTVTKTRLQQELLEVEGFYAGYVLLVTHDLTEAYNLSQSMTVIDTGKVLQAGPKSQVLKSPATRAVAALTGVRNIWEADVLQVDPFSARLYVPALNTHLFVSGSFPALAGGQKLFTGIRSENIQLSKHTGQNTVEGTVVRSLDGVTARTVVIAMPTCTGDSTFKIEASVNHTAPNISIGDSCRFKIPEDKLFLVPN
jgi:molybdate transport system ATP-binding protein